MRVAAPIVALAGYLFFLGCGGSNSPSTPTNPGLLQTTTVLAATPNPVTAGGSVTLTASVTTTGSTTPTGSVSFYDSATLLGTVALGASSTNSATVVYTTTTLAAGVSHSLTASYAGSAALSASNSTAVSLVVNAPVPAMTSTSLTATPNPVAAGAAVTLSASVTSAAGTPTGSVTFVDGTASLATVTLTNGAATLSISTLSPGTTHTITASYGATASFAASASPAVALVVNAVPPAATSLSLTATPNPVAAGAAATLTATITSTAGTPTGSIAFFDGSTNLGVIALNASGVAVFSTSTLSPGATHSLTATYAGNSSFAPSTSLSVPLVVNAVVPVATTTALTATPNPAAAAATVTVTATVTSANTSAIPTGSVSFYDGTTLLGAVALGSGTGNTATAVYTTSTLAAGTTHNLTATLVGNTNFTTSTSAVVALVVNPSYTATASFSFTSPHQTIMGFGGAEAFYASYLDSHPNESQIMTALFDPIKGLGITFLRLQNNYYNYNGSNASTFDTDNTKIVTGATAALGTAPTILLSSWSPPASLKSNSSTNGCTGVTNGNCTSGFGTLAQVSGAYNYAGFGQFWLSSLQAYAALSVKPNYISIQNEPDFPATYAGCLFNPTEAPADLYNGTQSYASYGKAFDATYQAINASNTNLTTVPKMIGPESFSTPNAQALLTQVPANELAVVAHHLYNVSSYSGNPQGQVAPMTALNADYPTSLKFETEYFQTPGFYNAVDIHNALTIANDNVYLYWGLAWPSTLASGVSTDQQGLLYIDNPFASQSSWAYPSGWTYNDAYYTLKHFSFFIRPGYIRYDASVSNADEDISVYQSSDTKTTVIVILNTSTTATDTIGLNLSSITYANSAVYRSSFATAINIQGAERWNNLGAYTPQGISLPPQSEVTVVLAN
jgi:O-glycosyl hydrolase